MRTRNGSIFLIALGAMTVLFILGFSITFFTGSEDWSSSISYESEVAFNLAESAVEEFVARLKYALNHDDSNNQLYKVLRSAAPIKENQEIPLEDAQVARLTNYTRETARQLYGIQFGQGLVSSRDFSVNALIKLNNIRPVEAKSGNTPLYTFIKDPKEKQAELAVTAQCTYRGRTAKVSLVFLLRVVKSFVPPFNYFTLYVKDGTAFGGSDFNTWESSVGEQQNSLVLDNGWKSIKNDFDAVRDWAFWENALSAGGDPTKSQVPPGRVYLGQDPTLQVPPSIFLQSTNGTKLLTDQPSDGAAKISHVNAQENFFLKFDIPWLGMDDYVKNFMKIQGQDKVKENWWNLFSTGWDNNVKVRVRNVGSGKELEDIDWDGVPAFSNAMKSYNAFRGYRIGASGNIPKEVAERLYPKAALSGLDLFGSAPCIDRPRPSGGSIKTADLSPTLVYGPVWRMYYRIVSVKLPSVGDEFALPFLGTDPDNQAAAIPVAAGRTKELSATESYFLYDLCRVDKAYNDKINAAWSRFPTGLKRVDKYEKFMSNAGVEPYNAGLGNFINRMQDIKDAYKGPLKDHIMPFIANEKFAGMPSELNNAVSDSPMREYYQGDLWNALPDEMSMYLLDFYFIPRSTEDFFRGRTTMSSGGNSFDRFDFKYINDVKAYLSGAKNQTLELNGILALNDPEPLVLRNLNFRGRGVIYSSPMMGGGPVVVAGDFFPAAAMSGATAAMGSNPDNDLITIIAPQIIIDTTSAQSDPCYVEANLISVKEPMIVKGTKRLTIKGTLVCPTMDLKKSFPNGGKIIYNPLNAIWRNNPRLKDDMYIAKVVTGGVGKFEWKYENE
ncbi:MAG: hypothetical protein HQM09_00185 [Candidatus Riflebacteria bacterium]|nr:hypothetical protein [Candidatus Riflebacteria bacterium]